MLFSLLHFIWCGMTEIPARWILIAPKGCIDCNRNSRTPQCPPHPQPLQTQTNLQPASMAQKPMLSLHLKHRDFGAADTLISHPKSLISFLWSLFRGRRSIRMGRLVVHLVLKQPLPFISHAVHIKTYDIWYSKADLNALPWGFPKVLWQIFSVSFSLSFSPLLLFFIFMRMCSLSCQALSQSAGWLDWLFEREESVQKKTSLNEILWDLHLVIFRDYSGFQWPGGI